MPVVLAGGQIFFFDPKVPTNDDCDDIILRSQLELEFLIFRNDSTVYDS